MAKFRDLKESASYISERHFGVSHRTIETWEDLPKRIILKKQRNTEAELDAAAKRRIDAANAKLEIASRT
jgi:hypothetical protein